MSKRTSSRPDIQGALDPNMAGNGSKKGQNRSKNRPASSLGGGRIPLDTSSSLKRSNISDKYEVEDLTELRDAIIELYLAIKIRSTEEVSCANGGRF